jgi:hypothetical protein
MGKANGFDDQALVTGRAGERDFIAGKLQPTAQREIIDSKRLIVAGDEGDPRLAPAPIFRANDRSVGDAQFREDHPFDFRRIPASPALSPTLTNSSARRASSQATQVSHVSDSWQPTPTARPFTPAITRTSMR